MLDNYQKFYKAIFKDDFWSPFETMKLPPDYKETVCYVLEETGLEAKWIDAAERRYGIGRYKTEESLTAIAAVYGVADTTVKYYLYNCLRWCAYSSRRKLLQKGLAAYEKENESFHTFPDQAMEFQKKYQALEAERQRLLLEKAKVVASMKDLVKAFATEHNLDEGKAALLAKRKPTKLSFVQVEDLKRGFKLKGDNV